MSEPSAVFHSRLVDLQNGRGLFAGESFGLAAAWMNINCGAAAAVVVGLDRSIGGMVIMLGFMES